VIEMLQLCLDAASDAVVIVCVMCRMFYAEHRVTLADGTEVTLLFSRLAGTYVPSKSLLEGTGR
jgi:hypothetical protein